MRTEEGWGLKAESREGDHHILTSSHPRGCWGRGRIHGEAGGRAEGCTSLLPGRRPVSDPFPPGNQLSVRQRTLGWESRDPGLWLPCFLGFGFHKMGVSAFLTSLGCKADQEESMPMRTLEKLGVGIHYENKETYRSNHKRSRK